jgi:D-inositol-3-phosphate glycosyltransferase
MNQILKKRLNIAILSVHSSPLGQPGAGDTGGMSIYIRELTRELAGQGHRVDIYTRVQDAVTPEVIDIAPGARQIHIPAGEPVDLDKLLIYAHVPDFACKVEGFRKQNGLRYDIIYSNYWISGMAGRFLQAWWRVPHMIMFHTLGTIKNFIGIGEDEPELRIAAEGQLALECDRVIASTSYEKNVLVEQYGIPTQRISIVPCGVNFDLFKPSDKVRARRRLGLAEKGIILFVGRLERLKGIDKIIRALPLLGETRPLLLVVGEDGNRMGEAENLKALAAELGVSEQVIFVGLVSYEILPDYYNAADVVAFPSYYESFGLVPLESLACGTPVVATDVGDLKNIILEGKTGFILEDNQPVHLAEKLSEVLECPLNFSLPEEIRASISDYDWKNVAESIAEECLVLISPLPVKS